MARVKGSKNTKPRRSALENKTISDKNYMLTAIRCHDKKDVAINTYTAKAVMGKIERQELDIHPLNQRSNNQWNVKQQSKLLVTIANNNPIGNIVVAVDPDRREVNNQDVYILVDGLQRLTTITNFMNDKIKIGRSEGIISVEYTNVANPREVIHEQINIGGKYFSQLPELIQNQFRDYRLTFAEYGKEYGAEEIDEIMFSLNNGSPFKPWQKVKTKLGMTRIAEIQDILNDTDWESVDGVIIKDGKCKNDANLGCVVRSMMLIDENNMGKDGLSVTAVNKYIDSLNRDEDLDDKFYELASELTDLFNDFNELVGMSGSGRMNDFISIDTLPHIIAGIKCFKAMNVGSMQDYMNFLIAFVNDEFEFCEDNTFDMFCSAKDSVKDSGSAWYGANVVETKQGIINQAISDFFNSNDELDGFASTDNSNTEESSSEDISIISNNYDPQTLLDFDEVIIPSSSDDEQDEYQDYNIHYIQNDDHDNIYDDNDDFSDETENADYASASSY